jgi:hypothetical protein
MIEATVQLLAKRTPDEITIRDIAVVSGHHHRFVQAWFGGKVGLFRDVHEHLNEKIAERLRPPISAEAFADDVRTTTSLMNWLIATDPESLSGPRPTPILDRITAIYHDTYGLEPATARLMAVRAVAGSIAASLFPGPLGLSSDDRVEYGALELRLVELLAASQKDD